MTTIDDKYEQYGPGAKLLFKCGWQHGQKLGKFEQGLSKPITVIKRQDRVGLGAERKTVWNDLWWERYLSDAINKNLERFTNTEKETDKEGRFSKEDNSFGNEQRKKKKKSTHSKKQKKTSSKKDHKKRKTQRK